MIGAILSRLTQIASTINAVLNSSDPVTVNSNDGIITGPIQSTTVPTDTPSGVLQRFDMKGFQSLTVDVVAPSDYGLTFVVEGNNTGQDNDQWYLCVPVFADAPSANSSGTLSTGAAANAIAAHSYAYTRYHRYMRVRRLTSSRPGSVSFVFHQSTTRVPNQVSGIAPGGIQNEGNTYNPAATGTAFQTNLGITRLSNSPIASGGVYTAPSFTSGGAALVKPYSVPEADWQATSTTAGLSTTASTALRAVAGATLRNYMTALQVSNTTATATTIRVLDGATEIWARNLPANAEKEYTFPTPLKSSLNTALNIQLGTATNVIWNAQGYQAP